MGRLIVVVLGKQGAGKGTQCERLSAARSIPHVSTGDMLRAAIKSGSALGQRVKAVVDSGELVSDDLIIQLVADRLAQPDAAKGALLDGATRTLAQAEALDGLLGSELSLALNIDLPTERVVERLSQRRVCGNCGTIYTATDPSATTGVCAKCGGPVVQRDDDTPDAINRRLAAYERDTAPLLAYYERRGLLESVNGDQPIDDVSRDVDLALARRGYP